MNQLGGQRHLETLYPISGQYRNFSYTFHAGQSPRGGCEVYHCDVRIFFDEIADDSHLGLEVWSPYFLYPRHRFQWKLQRRRRPSADVVSECGEKIEKRVGMGEKTEIIFASVSLIHLSRHDRRRSGHLQAQTIQTVAVVESAACGKLSGRSLGGWHCSGERRFPRCGRRQVKKATESPPKTKSTA